ncbi:hypothetical protein KCM76_10335 [Zooshikella marina]|uniref:hypothetical protein n=1 Tax=Zooshikella ganghwensis TaxID=202772 RepID=UPI001BAF0736|nr:hypothetical protein [Zooshikella ganghwensis]MBU2706387.1 hypothetical protein [Zooshikella ganghwensis]
MKSHFFKKTISMFVILMPATSSYSLPVLEGNKFFAPSSLFISSDWLYTGTIPSSVDAGFKAKNIDDPIIICVPLFGCSEFGGDQQFATGRRTMTATDGANPAYTLTFRGEFMGETFEAWEDSLLDQSLGKKFDSDVDSVEFPAPGGAITNEHPIPDEWRSLNGYASPTGSHAKFNKTYSLSHSYINAGEFGCPIDAGHCRYTESFFKGGANLEAMLQGSGSIENVVAGTQSVNINAKANRITTFKVNDDPVFSGEINGTASSFTLEEEKIKSIDFSFTGNFADKSFTIGADVQWDGSGDTSSFDASYVRRVEMPDFVSVGFAEEFIVEVRDDPQLTAGIEGTDFFKAKVLASSGMSAIDSVLRPVFEPVESGRLSILNAKVTNKGRLLKIPDSIFLNDRSLQFDIGIINDGFIDIMVNDIAISIFDEDIFFDDLLASFINDNLNFILSPGQMFNFAFNVDVMAGALNDAVDLFEGNYLEFEAIGKFSYSDSFGTRTREFSAIFVPEPRALLFMLVGLTMIFRMKKNNRKKS